MKHSALALLVLLACGPGTPEGPEGPHLLWEADAQSLDNPFPDARLLVDGRAQLRLDYFRPFVMAKSVDAKMRALFRSYADAAKDDVRGFNNYGPTLLLPSVPVDRATLKGTVARLVKDGDGFRVLEREVTVEHARDALIGTDVEAPEDFPEFFLARPGVPMPEGSSGLLVVLEGIKTADGTLLKRGRAFAKSDAGDIAAAATALGVEPAQVLLTLPITPVAVTSRWPALVSWVESAAGLPTVTIPAKGKVEAFGGGQRPVGNYARGEPEFDAMRYWIETTGFSKPATSVGRVIIGQIGARDLRENGAWRADWEADPSKAPVVPLDFILTIPTGTKPAGGWPTVIATHGIGGRNVPADGSNQGFCGDFAQVLAARGMACIGIDAPSHGQRGAFTLFFDVERLQVIRENFREMPFDLLQLARAVPTIDVDGDGAPDLAEQVALLGNSLGGIMGSEFVPIAPARLTHAVLNVPGGGLSNILVGARVRDLVGLLLCAKTNLAFGSPEYYSAIAMFRTIAQPFLEPTDPINLASALPKNRAVLMQLGKNDLTMPNETTERLAAAMQLTATTDSITGTTPLQVFTRHEGSTYLPGDKGQNYDGHNIMYDFAPVRAQVLRFLETRGTELVKAP